MQTRPGVPAVYRPVAPAAQAKLSGPPVYRPTPPAPQARSSAPPVYRPGAQPVQKQIEPPPVYRPPATAQAKVATRWPVTKQRVAVVQPFKVLGSSQLLDRMPAKRPWFGYPYAVVERADFPVQVHQRRARHGQEFLNRRGGADVEFTDTGAMRLRVSDDNQMAIEDSNLENRQPKAFYASHSVIAAANTQLQHVQSQFQLKEKGQSIRILPGWTGSLVLYKVEPQYLMGGKKKNPNWAPQNCNDMAQQVTGMGALGITGGGQSSRVASRIAGFGDRPQDAREDALLAGHYVRGTTPYKARTQRANEYALPDVGDAYMIATQATGGPSPKGAAYSRVHDIESGEDRDVAWSYHFAGVVAQSGNDRVTLENYARGDDRQQGADPRWYFQMYGTSSGQTFHEQNKATKQYANPATISIRNRRLSALPPTPDLRDEDAAAWRAVLDAV